MTPAETQTAAEAVQPLWFFILLFACFPFTAVAAWRLGRWLLSSAPVPPPIESDVPAAPWQSWTGVALFAGLQISMGLVVAAYRLAVKSGLVPAEPPGGIAMFSPGIFLAQIVPLLIWLLVVRLCHRNGLAAVGVRSGRLLTGVGYGVVAFLAVLPVCFLALAANEHLNGLVGIPVHEHPLEEVVRLHRETWVVLLAIAQAGVLAAVCEEFAFRGILMMSLLRPIGAVWAMVLTSIVFAPVHLPNEPQAILPLTVLGLALAYVAYRTRSLVAPIITHFLFNTFMLLTTFTASA